ncbi:MAG: lamin tail domain-containing protein [Verrucomicrobium sp.]|nr:lamin tail domain-containing protein [Verrucomicrobium sp.]
MHPSIPLLAPAARLIRNWLAVVVGIGLALGVGARASALEILRPPVSQTIFIGDPVSFRVEARGGPAIQYRWLRNGKPVDGASGPDLTFITSAADHEVSITAEVIDGPSRITSVPARLTIDPGLPGEYRTNRLVEVVHPWRYRVDGVLPLPQWPGLVDDRTGWSTGGGVLYVEDSELPGPKTTPLPATAGKLPQTAYFLSTFLNPITNAHSVELLASVLVDDGALVFLNGSEVQRLGLDEGTVLPTTQANRGVGNAAWEGPFPWATTGLKPGTNTLAVEVHQSGTASSDLVWSLLLDAVWRERVRDTVAPKVALTTPPPGAAVGAAARIEVQFTEPVRGVTAPALRLNGQPATAVTELAPDRYAFEFTTAPAGSVNLAWSADPGITDRSAGANRLDTRSFSNPVGPVIQPTRLPFASVGQSSDASADTPATLGADNRESTSSRTADQPGSHWWGRLSRIHRLQRVEGVLPAAPEDALGRGLVLRLLRMDDQVVFEQDVPPADANGAWAVDLPAGVAARTVWIGLPGDRTNARGTRQVAVAEVRVSGVPDIPFGPPPPVAGTALDRLVVSNNLASFKRSTMLRLTDGLSPASRANDDKASTETKTTERTVDGYWEVDLGGTFALHGIRTIAASGIGGRLTNATVRLYDDRHDSVFARRITGRPDTFDTDFGGPVFARYVRVGLEDKRRTDPGGGIEWYIGFREVAVFGRPTNEVGILTFEADPAAAGPAGRTLSWQVEDVLRLELHPGAGSVGSLTAADGRGSIRLTPATSTEYLLVASNTAGMFIRAASVEVPGSPLPVRLDELVAANRFSMATASGDATDWIELRNPGNQPVDLAGWSLSDDLARPRKWTFPRWVLEPHQSRVLFASGSDRGLDSSGDLHVGFRLSRAGGVLLLVPPAASGEPTQRVDYPALGDDLAYGRDLAGQWRMLDPTPGRPNVAASHEGWVRAPEWSHPRGFHNQAFRLVLTAPDPGSTILYSTNGTEPSLVYSNGLDVARTMSVRARAVRAGARPSPLQTRTFVFVEDVVASPSMNRTITQNAALAARLRTGLRAIPTIALSLPGQPEYEEKPGSFEILWPDGRESVHVNCGLSRFGNAWTSFAKRSFRVKCRNRYGDDAIRTPLFDGFDHGRTPVRSFDQLDLRSGSHDMSERGFYMAGRFVEDSMLDMGSLNPHGRFVHVYVNGAYWGQYDCRELLSERFLAVYLGGSRDDYGAVMGNDNVTDDFVIGAPEPPNLDPWERARGDRNSYERVRARLDVAHLIDFMLLWTYGDCESEFRSCGPLEPGSGFKFWIADADGFLRTSALTLNRTDREGPGGFFGALVREGHPDFRTLLADRIHRHFFNDGALTPGALDRRLDLRMREIADSLVAESARWNQRTPATWEGAAATIRSQLFPRRTATLLGQWRSRGLYPSFDPPKFEVRGGTVAAGYRPRLSAPAGTIFYTLDGSDPRLPGGAVSPAAKPWIPDAVTVASEVTLTTRVRSAAGAWSAVDAATFRLQAPRRPAPGDLLPVEIHYNPSTGGESEFIELRNLSNDPLDLSRCALSGGIGLVFPEGLMLAPGASLVAVRDPIGFAARYLAPGSAGARAGIRTLGPWVGALDNAGERIALLGADGAELWAFTFGTRSPWPVRADGGGRSLVLSEPASPPVGREAVNAYLGEGRRWLPSLSDHGTPGWADPFRASVAATPDGPMLEWSTISGETYRVEATERLGDPVWTVLEQGPAPRDEVRRRPLAPPRVPPSPAPPEPLPDLTRFYRVLWVR